MPLRSFSRLMARSAVVIALAACTESTAPVRAVAQLEIVSGALQEVLGGGLLPDPLTVRALDAQGAPVRGVTIRWMENGGTLVNEESVTGSDGTASANWYLTVPSGKVTAEAATNSSARARFSARAFSGPRLEFFTFTDTVAIVDQYTPVEVNVTARVSTGFRGIHRVSIRFRHYDTGFSSTYYDLPLSDGDAFSGTYSGTVRMYAAPLTGRWDYLLQITTRGEGSCDCDADPTLLLGAFQLNLHYGAPRYLILTDD